MRGEVQYAEPDKASASLLWVCSLWLYLAASALAGRLSRHFPWPAVASQVCAISQCQHLSRRLIQLRLRQFPGKSESDRGQFDFADQLCAFCFLFFFQLWFLLCLPLAPGRLDRRGLSHLCWRQASVAHLFEVLGKYWKNVTHCGLIYYAPLCVYFTLLFDFTCSNS